ncbi:hypothetical protein V1509DRAFT_629589 [Lipomyces kononenkoae]
MKSLPETKRLSQCGNSTAVASRTRQATRNSKLKPYCGVLKLDCTPPCPGSASAPRALITIMGFDKARHGDSENFTQIIITDMQIRTSKRVSNKGRNGAGYNTHINAFIGFRTYYSRILPNIHQHRLSSCLAKTWSTYIHKDFWTRYTVLYCAEPRSQCFVDWLIERVIPPDLPLLDMLELEIALSSGERGTKCSKKEGNIPIEGAFAMRQRTEPNLDIGKPEFQGLEMDHFYDDDELIRTAGQSDLQIPVAETFIDGLSAYRALDDFAVSPTIDPMTFAPYSMLLVEDPGHLSVTF